MELEKQFKLEQRKYFMQIKENDIQTEECNANYCMNINVIVKKELHELNTVKYE